VIVSRETEEKLKIYEALLHKWQKAINLVSSQTLPKAWERHFIDSAQIYDYVSRETKGPYLDVGSGAGFPGMVLSLCGLSDVTLIESDQRKIEFLKTVKRETHASVTLLCERVETVEKPYRTLLMRGFRSIKESFSLTQHLMTSETSYVMWKGEHYVQEIDDANKEWSFQWHTIGSITKDGSAILHIYNIAKK
jgi:16S rRNA (guanine527-N7)-methyltransferase